MLTKVSCDMQSTPERTTASFLARCERVQKLPRLSDPNATLPCLDQVGEGRWELSRNQGYIRYRSGSRKLQTSYLDRTALCCHKSRGSFVFKTWSAILCQSWNLSIFYTYLPRMITILLIRNTQGGRSLCGQLMVVFYRHNLGLKFNEKFHTRRAMTLFFLVRVGQWRRRLHHSMHCWKWYHLCPLVSTKYNCLRFMHLRNFETSAVVFVCTGKQSSIPIVFCLRRKWIVI